MKTKAQSVVLLLICSTFISLSGHSQGKYYKGYPAHPYPTYPYAYPHVHPYAVYPYAPIYYGGVYYHYNHGCFYRPYGPSLQLVVPPIGIHIGTLPYGFMSFYIGPAPYYYYNGIFYRPSGSEYEVVAPPLGAVVNRLPQGSKVKVINGEKYYELNGTYYKEQFDERNKLSYRVVGTDGVLNTNTDPGENTSTDLQTGGKTNQAPAEDKTSVRQL